LVFLDRWICPLSHIKSPKMGKLYKHDFFDVEVGYAYSHKIIGYCGP